MPRVTARARIRRDPKILQVIKHGHLARMETLAKATANLQQRNDVLEISLEADELFQRELAAKKS